MKRKCLSVVLVLCTFALTLIAAPAQAHGGWGHGGWGYRGYHGGGWGHHYYGGYGSGFGLGLLGGALLGRRYYAPPYPYPYPSPYAGYGAYGYPPPPYGGVNVYTRAYPW